jgi:CheY-like chemotaxis protein
MMNPLQKERILIADHDQTFLDQLADRLLQMDMEVDFAENGRTAIQLVESESYDLIITEIAMPIYNGLEILRKAKEHNPKTPVLITSFSATTDWAEQAIREGAQSYLLRPLTNMKEFDQAVEDALQDGQSPQENTFYNQFFSKGEPDFPSPIPADIPAPDWELEHDLGQSTSHLDLSQPQPLKPIQSIPEFDTPANTGMPEKIYAAQTSLPEGFIELNSQGQILSCDPAARKWLMLEANTHERPIKQYIKILGSKGVPDHLETHVNGRTVQITSKRLRDRMGTERIILQIQEGKQQASAFPTESMNKNSHPVKQQAKAEAAVAFGGNLKKYHTDTLDQGWSPLMFIDQMKRTIKDEVEKIRSNNPLQMFEQRPEEVDPEVIMTMSQRLSEISRGRRTTY